MGVRRLIGKILIKIKYRKSCVFGFSCDINPCSTFEGLNRIYPKTSFSGELGLGSYISSFCYINGKIGRFCSIAQNVKVVMGVHPYSYPYVTTSPYFFSNRRQNGDSLYDKSLFEEFRYADSEKKHSVIIGNDCWIGYGVLIISGVTIGDGAMILAGAVVTKDIPPYAIAAGIPAKIVSYRYDEKTIAYLLKYKWWNHSLSWLKEHKEALLNMDELMECDD